MQIGRTVSSAALALGVAVLGLSLVARAQPDDAGALVGVWGTERILGPEIRGRITIRRRGATFRASAAGFEAAGEIVNGDLRFTFPGNRGELRLHRAAAGPAGALWVQPVTVTQGVRYATPVALLPLGPNGWRGTIVPLDDRIEMYLRIARGPDGTPAAFIRDPLANAGAFVRITGLERSGKTVRFALRDGDPVSATLDDKGDAMTLQLRRYPVPLVFTRRDPLHAAGFYPRTPGARVGYRVPPPAGDGWEVADAASVGLAAAPLAAVVDQIGASDTTALTSPYVHSISVARHGKLVLDEYFAGFSEASLHDTRSAGKSYAPVLVGAARLTGARIDDTTPLLPLFPYRTYAHADPRKRAITVGNALTMATGLDCDDSDEKSIGNEDTMQNQDQQPDWYKYVLDTAMVRDPGTKAVYCSGSTNLAGGAVVGATHRWLPLFFAERIAQPLQMEHYALNLTPTGEMYLGGGAYVRARDFLKLGQLFLDGGAWHGTRVVARDWIERTWRPRLPLGEGDDYGLAWHTRSYTVGGKAYRAHEAQGNGGQILDVIPQLDMAIMLTQGNYNNFRTWGATRDDVVTKIIESVRSQ